MNFLQRRRARFLVKRAQPFADEQLVAVANFTWVGNSMGARPGVRGRAEWAGGLPDWTLIGAGATRLYVVAATHSRPDKGVALIGSWALTTVGLTEESYDRNVGVCRWALGGQYVSSSQTVSRRCCNRSAGKWTIFWPRTGRRRPWI